MRFVVFATAFLTLLLTLTTTTATCPCSDDRATCTINTEAEMVSLSACVNASILVISGPDFVNMSSFPSSLMVNSLTIDNAPNLETLDGLEGLYNTHMSALDSYGLIAFSRKIILNDLPKLKDISALSSFTYIRRLDVTDVPLLETLDGLENLIWDSVEDTSLFAALYNLYALTDISAVDWVQISPVPPRQLTVDIWNAPLLLDDHVGNLVDIPSHCRIEYTHTGLVAPPLANAPFVKIWEAAHLCQNVPSPSFYLMDPLSDLGGASNCPMAAAGVSGTPYTGLPFGSFATFVFNPDAAPVLGGGLNLTVPSQIDISPSLLALLPPIMDSNPHPSRPLDTSGISLSSSGKVVTLHFDSSLPLQWLPNGFSLAGLFAGLTTGLTGDFSWDLFDASGTVLSSWTSSGITLSRAPAPQITTVNGESTFRVNYAGGVTLTLGGTSLGYRVEDILNVSFAGQLCSPVLSVTPTQIECVAPGGLTPGAVPSVQVLTRSSGLSPSTNAASLAYADPVAAPTTAITPDDSPAPGVLKYEGGQEITLVGSSFGTSLANVEEILIGSSPCVPRSMPVVNTQVVCLTSPFSPADVEAAQAGTLSVTVRTTSSNSLWSAPANSLFSAIRTPRPTVTALNGEQTAVGSLLGNEPVTLTGSSFGYSASDILGVWLADIPCASFSWVSPISIVCTTGRSAVATSGPPRINTRSSGGQNSTSPVGVLFSYVAESQSLEETVSFAVAAASSMALALYILLFLIAAAIFISLYKRRKNKRRMAEFSKFRPVSYMEKLFTDHSVLGIAYYDASHPFTRFSRVLTLVLEVMINFLSVLLVTVVAPVVYSDSSASARLRRETNTSGDWLLALAMGTTLSILVGKPILQSVLESSSTTSSSTGLCKWSARVWAQGTAALINLCLLSLNVLICIDPDLLFSSTTSATSSKSYSINTASLIVRFVANMLLSWVITEPILTLIKMKVWLDTVIRTRRYQVSVADAKASNVVKSPAYFTDRMQSESSSNLSSGDNGDGDGNKKNIPLVSVPLARRSKRRVKRSPTTRTPGTSGSKRVRTGSFIQRSSLSANSDTSGLSSDNDDDDDGSSRSPGASVVSTRSARLSNSISDIIVISDNGDIMTTHVENPSALTSPVASASRRVRRKKSPASNSVSPTIPNTVGGDRAKPARRSDSVRSPKLNSSSPASPSIIQRQHSMPRSRRSTDASSPLNSSPSRRRLMRKSSSPLVQRNRSGSDSPASPNKLASHNASHSGITTIRSSPSQRSPSRRRLAKANSSSSPSSRATSSTRVATGASPGTPSPLRGDVQVKRKPSYGNTPIRRNSSFTSRANQT